MKKLTRKIIFISSFVFLLTLQQIYAQETPKSIELKYIVDKLHSTIRNKKKNEITNAKLIEEVQARKVSFILSEQNEEFLRKTGGNDLLIKAIKENVSEAILESEKEHAEQVSLYQKFLNNRKGPTLENYKIALETAKEYLEKYEMIHTDDDVSRYIKYQIPKLEEKIKSLQNQ